MTCDRASRRAFDVLLQTYHRTGTPHIAKDDSPLSQQVHAQQSPPSNPQAWVLCSSSHLPSPKRTTETVLQSRSLSKAADTPVHNAAHNSRVTCHKVNRTMVAVLFCASAKVHPAETLKWVCRFSCARKGNRRARHVRERTPTKDTKKTGSFAGTLPNPLTTARMVPC